MAIPKSISRRQFLKTTGLTVASLSALPLLEGCGDSSSSGHSPGPKPNIILITADDLGWYDLGCFGNRQTATPNIDRLSTEGVRFSNAFVTSSSCSPSRAAMLTGQYPHTNGVVGLTHRHPEMSLPADHVTLPRLLEAAGYYTAIEGKWHVSVNDTPKAFGYREELNNVLDEHIRNTRRTLDFLERRKDERFFFHINYMNNHRLLKGNFEFDPDFPVDPDALDVPEYMNLPDWPEIRLDLAKYYSQTQKMDSMIGEVLAKLDELKLAGNTLVVFVSDNGPSFPGNKMTLYDRGTRTPLIMRWPRRLKGGATVAGLVNTIDLMPTILAAAGLPIPAQVQGLSVLPQLLDPEAGGPAREALFTEMTYHANYIPTRAVRTAEWKYIRNYSNIAFGGGDPGATEWAHRLLELPDQPWGRPRVEEELYNLVDDPQERTNLVSDASVRPALDRMRGLLHRQMAATKDPFLDAPFTNDYQPAARDTGARSTSSF